MATRKLDIMITPAEGRADTVILTSTAMGCVFPIKVEGIGAAVDALHNEWMQLTEEDENAVRIIADFQPVGQEAPDLYHGTIEGMEVVWDDGREAVPGYVRSKVVGFVRTIGIEGYSRKERIALGLGVGMVLIG